MNMECDQFKEIDSIPNEFLTPHHSNDKSYREFDHTLTDCTKQGHEIAEESLT